MDHQNFQEAIAQLSVEDLKSEEIKNKFNLSEEEIKAIKISPLLQSAAPRATGYCCSCTSQSDN